MSKPDLIPLLFADGLQASMRIYRPFRNGQQDRSKNPVLTVQNPTAFRTQRLPLYTGCVLDEDKFRRTAADALGALRKGLIQAENELEFEVEERDGVLTITLEGPPTTLTLTPNVPTRQIWLNAPPANLQLDWDEAAHLFVLIKTGEPLRPLIARLMREHSGMDEISLG
jgi:CyaY protein